MPNPRIQDKRQFSPDENCPTCGKETEIGFGLAGGGYGPYTYCQYCEIVTSKSPDPTDNKEFLQEYNGPEKP